MKPDVALKQLDAEKPSPASETTYVPSPTSAASTLRERDTGVQTGTLGFDPLPPTSPKQTKRFHGAVSIDPTRMGRDAGRIGDEVIQHLAGLVGAKVRITLEISVETTDGIPDNIIRNVTENCRTLKFQSHEFEEE